MTHVLFAAASLHLAYVLLHEPDPLADEGLWTWPAIALITDAAYLAATVLGLPGVALLLRGAWLASMVRVPLGLAPWHDDPHARALPY